MLSFGQKYETEYLENLKLASDLYLKKEKIPDAVLLNLVPKNHPEFEHYYGTTYPENRMYETSFFHDSSQKIFEKVIDSKNDRFYLPSLQLISFADGEYAEGFIEYLELIIEMDKEKFCKSINGKEYANQNPIKYYSDITCK